MSHYMTDGCQIITATSTESTPAQGVNNNISPVPTALTNEQPSSVLTPNNSRISPNPLMTKSKRNLLSPVRRTADYHNIKTFSNSSTSNNHLDNGMLQSMERQNADLVLSNTSLRHEFEELETSFKQQEDMISTQDYKIKDYENTLKQMNSSISHNKLLFEKELDYYHALVSNLQLKVDHLSNELSNRGEQDFELRDNYERMTKDFKILQANYELEQNSKSVLLEQVEILSLEVNKWHIASISSTNTNSNTDMSSIPNISPLEKNPQNILAADHEILNDELHEQDSSHSVIRLSMMHTLTDEEDNDILVQDIVEADVDDDDEEEDEVDDLDDLSNILSYLDQELKFNSSLAPIQNTSHHSLEVADNFQFPSSGGQNGQFGSYNVNRNSIASTLTPYRNSLVQGLHSSQQQQSQMASKRFSVPVFGATNRFSMETVPDTDDEGSDESSSSSKFILSPFKLHSMTFELTAGGAGAAAAGMEASGGDGTGNLENSKALSTLADPNATAPAPATSSTTRRFSRSFPRHARYNSHDIIPIKVEFERETMQPNDHRIMSYPEQRLSFAKINEEDQFHMETFMKLNQAADRTLITGAGGKLVSNRNSLSSRASSIYMDQDMTRQEIMKLKFELQSLKLHNEKLLSYIGFELQKQKKNIRKLKSQNGLRVNCNSKNMAMDHSRSGSLSGMPSPSRSKPTVPRKLRGNVEYSDAKLIEQSKEELIYKKRVLRSISINPIMSIINPGKGEDNYGFLTHRDSFGKRIFLNGLHVYLQVDEDDADGNGIDGGAPGVRKCKSQTFNWVVPSGELDAIDSELGISSGTEDDYDDEVGDELTTSDESDEESITLFKQVKWLLFGEHYHRRHRKKMEHKLVDDQLTYKFLSIAIGIIIIGVRFLHPEPRQ